MKPFETFERLYGPIIISNLTKETPWIPTGLSYPDYDYRRSNEVQSADYNVYKPQLITNIKV